MPDETKGQTSHPALEGIGDGIEEIRQFLKIFTEGVASIRGFAAIAQVNSLAEEAGGKAPIPGPGLMPWKPYADGLKEVATWAQQHRDANFAFAYELATVRLWTHLEVGITDLAFDLLLTEKRWKENKAFAQVKGSVLQFSGWSEREQVSFLFDTVLNERRSKYKKGVGRFESMLGLVGMEGAVAPSIRKGILHFSEVRNLLVHRRGIVDGRFLRDCPFSNATLGQRLEITGEDHERQLQSVLGYAMEIQRRLEATSSPATTASDAAELAATMARLLDRFYEQWDDSTEV